MTNVNHKMEINLFKNTGRTLDQWVELVKRRKLSNSTQIINYLKVEHEFGQAYANFIATKWRSVDFN